MTVKTEVSRFHIHDELTAPDESAPILKSIQVGGRAVNKLVGVLAGSPAVLRAFTRMRVELQKGVLPQATRQRIALAVAEHRRDGYSIARYAKTAKGAGLGLDEITKARSFASADPREQALLTYLEAARMLAERMITTRIGARERLKFGFRAVTSRYPGRVELETLERSLVDRVAHFSSHPEEARRLLAIGEKRNRPDLNPAELAAHTVVASLILNLDESITRP